MNTAETSKPISGDKLYQQRARVALPLLVRQAQAGVTISYSNLAEELGMPNPHNLNYVLGSIGRSLEILSEEWKEKVPPIQCLVVNKNTDLPGNGIGWFLVKKEEFSALPLIKKRAIVEAELQHIFLYPRWAEVLKAFSLDPVDANYTSLIETVARRGGAGESEQHKALKEYVAHNPAAIGLKATTPHGITECSLLSGDFLDVSFRDEKIWVAAEVKSALSNEADIIRGLFQCVKYRAVMEAVLISQSRPQNARAILVLESKLPQSLIPLKNVLGIEVVDCVTPPNSVMRDE